jgi:hypothetical protein
MFINKINEFKKKCLLTNQGVKMKLFTKIAVLLTLTFICTNVNAQFKNFGLKGGAQFNGLMPAGFSSPNLLR